MKDGKAWFAFCFTYIETHWLPLHTDMISPMSSIEIPVTSARKECCRASCKQIHMQIGKKNSSKEIRSPHSFSKEKSHCYPVVSPGSTLQVCRPGEIWLVWISKMLHWVSGLDKHIGNGIVPWRSYCFRDGEHKVGTKQEALSMLSSTHPHHIHTPWNGMSLFQFQRHSKQRWGWQWGAAQGFHKTGWVTKRQRKSHVNKCTWGKQIPI